MQNVLQELYDSCDKMRPQLFRLASSATEDGDEGLGEILIKACTIFSGKEFKETKG